MTIDPEGDPAMRVEVAGTGRVVVAGTVEASIFLPLNPVPEGREAEVLRGDRPRVVEPTSSTLLPGVQVSLR